MSKKRSNDILRENMRYYRVINKLTQEQMAEKMNISEKHYCQLENGRYNLTFDNLDKLSDIFKLKSKDLLDDNIKKDNIPTRVDLYTGKRQKKRSLK